MRREFYYAYMMSNRSKTIAGVCGSLYKRVWEHKEGTYGGFTSR